jgi:hypothetical protein
MSLFVPAGSNSPKTALDVENREMTVILHRSFRSAFVIDEGALRRLDSILAECAGLRDYRVSMQNVGAVTLDSVEAVLNLRNSGEQAIQSIEISTARCPELWAEVRVTMQGKSPRIRYLIGSSNGDTDVHALSLKLDEWITGIRPWYSAIATVNVALLFLGLLVAAFLFPLLVFLIPSEFGASIESVHEVARRMLLQLLGSWTLVGSVLLTIAADAIRGNLFPAGAFAIGLGIERFERTKFRRNACLVAGGLFLIAALAALLLYAFSAGS